MNLYTILNNYFIQYFIACRMSLRKQDCHTMPAQEEDSHTIISAREAMEREVRTRTSLSRTSLSISTVPREAMQTEPRTHANRGQQTDIDASGHIAVSGHIHVSSYT